MAARISLVLAEGQLVLSAPPSLCPCKSSLRSIVPIDGEVQGPQGAEQLGIELGLSDPRAQAGVGWSW